MVFGHLERGTGLFELGISGQNKTEQKKFKNLHFICLRCYWPTGGGAVQQRASFVQPPSQVCTNSHTPCIIIRSLHHHNTGHVDRWDGLMNDRPQSAT